VNQPSSDQDRYSDEETERRAKALARAVMSMPPKPQKDIPRERPESKRQPDEPTSPHHAEHEDPAERAKTAMRKAGERNRRVKRPGASGIRGGTSED
jgi:predicted Zn-dependent protease